MEGGVLHEIVLTLIVGAILIVPVRRIFARAGLNPAIALSVFVPYVGFPVAYLVLAFSRWPATEGGPAAGDTEGERP